MPRYDAAKDVDLQKALQKTLEKQFFLNQYRKRKFIIDKNVLFDESDSEDTKNLVVDVFDCSNMKYDGACLLYQRVTESVKKIILQHPFFDVDHYKEDVFVYLSHGVKQAIDDLQWYIAYHHFELFQRDATPRIADPGLCKILLESTQITAMMMKLTLISTRYGMLITDLCSYPTDIEIKPSVDDKDHPLCRTFFHESDFDPRVNTHVLQEDDSLNRKRFFNFMEAAEAGVLDRLDAAAGKRALVNIVPGSFYSNSILKRRAGLWLWDKCDNPLTEQKKTKIEAIRDLSKKSFFEDKDQDSLIRDLSRVYVVTKKCIEAGEIMPIEDGKGKKNCPASHMD